MNVSKWKPFFIFILAATVSEIGAAQDSPGQIQNDAEKATKGQTIDSRIQRLRGQVLDDNEHKDPFQSPFPQVQQNPFGLRDLSEPRKPRSVEEVLKEITVDIPDLGSSFGFRMTALEKPEIIKLIKESDSDSKMQQLMKQRCLFAVNEFAGRLAEFRHGRSPVTAAIQAADRIAVAMLALDPPASARRLILQQRVAGAKEIERFAILSHGNGSSTSQEVFHAAYLRTTAEIELLADMESEKDDK